MTLVWTDRPRARASEDELDRAALGARIAARIQTVHDPEQSVVFGLVGPWGSGKTSLINFAAESLKRVNLDRPGWSIMDFSPWAATDAEGLLQEFYSALSSALPERGRVTKKARAALAEVVQIAAPLASGLPYGGLALRSSAEALAKKLQSRPTWKKAFEDASSHLRELDTPVLLVVDDVDRLQPDELMALLKVVRLLGRFPGVDYLLAYDHDSVVRIVSRALVSPHDGDTDFAARFVEKIVQYPFDVPPLRRDQVIERLSTGVAVMTNESSQTAFTTRGWNQFEKLFATVLTTPRAVDRYTEQHRIARAALGYGEYDVIDLDLAVLLRVRFPGVFSRLHVHKDELITGEAQDIRLTNERRPHGRPFDISLLVSDLGIAETDQAVRILKLIFPKLKDKDEITGRNHNVARRFAHPDYFERYVASEISPRDISDVQVRTAINEGLNGERSMLVELFARSSNSQRELVATKAMEVLEERPLAPDRQVALLGLVAEALSVIETSSPAHSGLGIRMVGWVASLIARLPADAEAAAVHLALAPLATSGIVFPVMRQVPDWKARQPSSVAGAWERDVDLWLMEAGVGYVSTHLSQGDQAPDESYFLSALYFLMEHGGREGAQAAVRGLISSGRATIEDLAARFVSIHGYSGPPTAWMIARNAAVDEGLEDILPDWDDPWFELPPEPNLDPTDVTWANRRRAARGRFSKQRMQP